MNEMGCCVCVCVCAAALSPRCLLQPYTVDRKRVMNPRLLLNQQDRPTVLNIDMHERRADFSCIIYRGLVCAPVTRGICRQIDGQTNYVGQRLGLVLIGDVLQLQCPFANCV